MMFATPLVCWCQLRHTYDPHGIRRPLPTTAHNPKRFGSVLVLDALDLEPSKPLRKRVDRSGASPYQSRRIGYRLCVSPCFALLLLAPSAIRSPGKPMPTYEYRCEKCNETFEMFQSMKDDALQVCPQQQCRMETWGQGKVKRLVGAGAGLIFKGSGFYVTDYRSQSYTEAAKKESGSKETGGAKTESSAPKTTKEKSSGDSGSKSES
jgi:putative FmdB family regulatory protein